ncbi:PEPxxWA-CTERM sorting domain-containing protein [Phenylobacterium sp.]|uniref:PEPxxWA-CTERM sorting domain-containing protein n=1 Tax=Phenylobacterium sp. TaxID=1871053 RepID=UPI0011F69CEB|nr:PEPxxWA-CTERM sorting domain-containing protein [Phenylobacterium sp.]THD67251.1 MAG: PEP-CTERM sorting domain-containing protein [Phenylobacterium sp.]
MRTFTKFLAASAAALSVAAVASAGHAATVTIWADDGDGSGLHQIAAGTDTASFSGVLGAFTVNHLSGSAGDSPVSDTQALDTIARGGAGGDLTVFVSVTGLTEPLGDIEWLSTFQTQPLGAGWSLTENTWLSPLDQPQTGTPLGSASMTTDALPQEFHDFATVDTGPGPYAINTEYVLHAGGAGSANSTIDVFNEGIPEPTTWGLMIMGFGGIGALVRGRRRQAALA